MDSFQLIGLLLKMLILGFVKESFFEVLRHYSVHFYSSLPFLFRIFMPMANLWSMRFQGQFPTLRKRSFTDRYLLNRLLRTSLAFGRGTILIPGSRATGLDVLTTRCPKLAG